MNKYMVKTEDGRIMIISTDESYDEVKSIVEEGSQISRIDDEDNRLDSDP